MSIRKEREKEFFVKHMDTFRNLKIADPFFTIKTAFFQKGKYGRHVQFFEWELKKEEDIFIEFCDNVKDDQGRDLDIVPMNTDRQLFKYKNNPFFNEEYELKESISSKGESYTSYTVPVSELLAILKDGTEITYALYEKRKADAETKIKEEEFELPRLQKTLFPDFEEQFPAKPEEKIGELALHITGEESASDILLRIAVEFQKLAQKLK
jgi:hypothetical protein